MVFFRNDDNRAESSSATLEVAGGSNKDTPLLDTTDQGDMEIVESPSTKSRTPENGSEQGISGSLDMGSVGVAASFVNEQVGKVRQLATEGPLSFRVLAFLGGLAMVITSVLDWIADIFRLSAFRALISVYTFMFGTVILILEGKMFVPETCKYQKKMFGLAKFLRYVWGRGLFYFFSGSLQFSQMTFLNMVSGGFMCFVGIVSIVTGWSTASKLKQMRESLINEATCNNKFKQHDIDQDEYLDSNEFTELVKDLGLEFDHNELVAAFCTIDRDDDKKISTNDFESWWERFQANSVREASMMV